MTLSVKHFLVVKDGSPDEHNDDALAADVDRGRFAISDGAAESGFSRVWSKLLVDQFVNHATGSPDDWSKWLPEAQSRWLAELKGVEIPWYGEQQFEQGSFATFLGLVVKTEGKRRLWHAVAVGDSCLFHVRAGKLQESFPLEESSQFNFTPKLVGSRSSIDEVAKKRAVPNHGTGQPEDRLWLISDALSKWCLAEEEAARPPWQELATFLSPDSPQTEFAAWIANLRADRGLHNDDVTLMAIDL
jgi:hypothetical protein